jgi:uncharacterized protein
MSGLSMVALVFAVAVACGAALYIALIVCVAHLFTTPKRVDVPAPPAVDGATFDRVQFRARDDGLELRAWYRAAPCANGAVILVHGRDACRGSELRGSTFELAAHFAALGLSVLMLDLRGHGESAASRLTFGRKERMDILGAVDFLLSRGYRRGSVGVLGASMGGAGAIAAAAEESAIGAIVTDSSFADLADLLRGQFSRLTRLPGCCLGSALFAARVLTGVDLVRNSPARDMLQLRGRPTLVIHAAGDPFVPVGHAKTLAIAGGTTLWITESERHLGSFNSGAPEYSAVVSNFFSRHLTGEFTVPQHMVNRARPAPLMSVVP